MANGFTPWKAAARPVDQYRILSDDKRPTLSRFWWTGRVVGSWDQDVCRFVGVVSEAVGRGWVVVREAVGEGSARRERVTR